jgi:hypothetical protein
MNKSIFGIGWLLAAAWMNVSAADDAWTPPEALVGTWEGKSKIHVPADKEITPGQPPSEPVAIRIRIAPNGNIEGQVGTARFVGCKLKSNRGWFGKWMDVKTDYIICDGCLQGPVPGLDQEAKHSFTVPFNLIDGVFKGSFMLLQKGKYPFPIFPNLELTKQPAAKTPEAAH